MQIEKQQQQKNTFRSNNRHCIEQQSRSAHNFLFTQQKEKKKMKQKQKTNAKTTLINQNI